MTQAELKLLLISLLPAGSEDLYDLDNSANLGRTFNALAGTLKDTLADRVDQLRLEVNPRSCVEDVPDWEAACGLSATDLARFGTLEQRRNAVLSVLREHGSFSLPDLQAGLAPYLLYSDPSQIEIIETDRDALRSAHTYSDAVPLAVGAASTGARSVTVLDDPRVSPAGAQVNVNLTANLSEVSLRLTAPDGSQKTWRPGHLGDGAVTSQVFTLFAPELADAAIHGRWTLAITTGASSATLTSWSLFVEGLGINLVGPPPYPPGRNGEGLGAAMFQFLVMIDPALLGTGYDLGGAYRAIQRLKPAHVLGNYGLKSQYGDNCAIPDDPQTLPDRCLPC